MLIIVPKWFDGDMEWTQKEWTTDGISILEGGSEPISFQGNVAKLKLPAGAFRIVDVKPTAGAR